MGGQGAVQLCDAKGNPSNAALTWKNVFFSEFNSLQWFTALLPLRAAAGSLLTSSRKQIGLLLGAKATACSLLKKSPGLKFLRTIFCMGTVYYLNKLQVATHPSSLRWPNCISTCSQDGLGSTHSKRAWQRQVVTQRFTVSTPDCSLCHCQALPFTNVFTTWCCEDPLACN